MKHISVFLTAFSIFQPFPSCIWVLMQCPSIHIKQTPAEFQMCKAQLFSALQKNPFHLNSCYTTKTPDISEVTAYTFSSKALLVFIISHYSLCTSAESGELESPHMRNVLITCTESQLDWNDVGLKR